MPNAISHFYNIFSLTHSWTWALLEKLPIVQLLKNFPAYYGTRRFITVFTRALHWSLFWARSIQSILSHSISLRSILILSTHLLHVLPSGIFPSGIPTNLLYAFLSSHFVLHALPILSSLTSIIDLTGNKEEYIRYDLKVQWEMSFRKGPI
jgi:hypothetical protein